MIGLRNIGLPLVVCISLLAGVLYGADEAAQTNIVALVQAGENIEAIQAYEALADRDGLDIDVLRAVAGSYWRERRFEEARLLYRSILKRQSNLNSLESSRGVDQTADIVPPPAGPSPAVEDEVGVQPVAADEVALAAVAAESPASVASESAASTEAVPSPSREAQQPEVMAEKQSATDSTRDSELELLKQKLDRLTAAREQGRLAAEARIAELAAEAADKSKQLEALQKQLDSQTADPQKSEEASRVTALEARIGNLEEHVSAARQENAKLEAAADRKINDLLDSIASEKSRREQMEVDLKATTAALDAQKALVERSSSELKQQLAKAEQQLKQERSLAQAAAAEHELREVELRARIAQVAASGEQAKLQVSTLEETLAALRKQLDTVRSRLSGPDDTLSHAIERVDQGSLELALDEIDRLEQEQAAHDALAARKQAELQKQINLLEAEATNDREALATLRGDLEDERRKRFELEAQTQSQRQLLDEKEALLAEAKAALARQYDALRQHVQKGSTIRLEDGDRANAETMQLSPDLVPMIGQLETATASAFDAVKELREKLDRERDVFETAIKAKDAEIETLQTDVAELNQRLEDVATVSSRKQSALEDKHAAAIADMNKEHESTVRELKRQLEAVRNMLETRDQAVAMLENELNAERAATARVLSMARETEAALTARIRKLESMTNMPPSEAAAPDSELKASPDDAVVDAILTMASSDQVAAIKRFEALPDEVRIPDALLKKMGNLYRERGQYAVARDLFQTLVDRNPEDAYAERKLVMTLFDMGLYDEALGRLSVPRVAEPQPEAK